MPKIWTISANNVGPGSNSSELVGCHLVRDNDDVTYHFETPGRTKAQTFVSPTVPFQFPVFQSSLAGRDDVSWYITVCSIGGPTGNQASGTFSNTGYVSCAGSGLGEPPDTWVAQAGPGVGEDEEDAAAASASAY